MIYPKYFDVIVVGGGHAGTEAARISARMKCKTLLLTNDIDQIGQMSCNPSIGGIGKGHLVKEIDALGGLMAKSIDKSGIHFKILNSSKGPAVRATRAQADRILYKKTIFHNLKKENNLFIFQQNVEKLIIKNLKIIGLITNLGIKFFSISLILTTGTFLNSKIYIGKKIFNKINTFNKKKINLSNSLYNLPLKIKRFKTGTPPRIDIKSINFNILKPDYSNNPIPYFSFIKYKNNIKQIPCYITHTNINTHNIIKKNLYHSPIFKKLIKSKGPQYCPSIEDKVIRFYERTSHQIFLEPEGLYSNEIYPNGISTSLPFDIQLKIIRSIKGLENAHIIRPGYSIEYDSIDSRDLNLSLECKFISNLFFAGQINGTTGYEEAAAQGILAGINAARKSKEKDCWWPRRDQAYIGVMLDDLCTVGTIEPYRMFTSRAEYRLILREDNADIRLTEIGYKLGTISNNRWLFFCNKLNKIEYEIQKLKNYSLIPNNKKLNIINKFINKPILKKINCENLLRRIEFNLIKLNKILNLNIFNKKIIEQIENKIKYEEYINRQNKEINNLLLNEKIILPNNINYKIISGLSNEIKNILNIKKPTTLGQASRIPGITPASISILLIWLKNKYKKLFTNTKFRKNIL